MNWRRDREKKGINAAPICPALLSDKLRHMPCSIQWRERKSKQPSNMKDPFFFSGGADNESPIIQHGTKQVSTLEHVCGGSEVLVCDGNGRNLHDGGREERVKKKCVTFA